MADPPPLLPAALPTWSILPLQAFSFAPLLFIFCILLQPSIPARLSTYGRLILLLPTLFLAGAAPFIWRFELVEWSIGGNFRWGIFGPNFVMKALEWGLLDEKERRSGLVWVGFDEEDEAKKKNRGEARTDGANEEHVKQAPTRRNSAGGTSTAVPAEGLRARLRSLPSIPSPAASSSGPVSTFLTHQLPTPAPSTPSPPSSPSSPAGTANPAPLMSSTASALSDAKVEAAAALHAAAAQRDNPLKILRDAFHLMCSMRGAGYAWGPPPRSRGHSSHSHDRQHDRGPPPSPTRSQFLRKQAVSFAHAHVLSTLCLAYQVAHRDGLVVPFLLSILPFSSSSPLVAYAAEKMANSLAYLTVGVSLYAQMLVGFAGVAIGTTIVSKAVNSVLDSMSAKTVWRWNFDPREWPPLFDRPFEKMGEGGVAGFWGKRWHALFRGPFTALGFVPSIRISRKLGLPKSVGKLIGTFVVFSMSAWMHYQALMSARQSLHPTSPALLYAASLSIPRSSLYPKLWSALSFRERYGTWIFFLAQPLAILLETLYVSWTRTRVGGVWGRVWTAFWVCCVGAWAVGKSWLALGLAHGMPPVQYWSWHRWVLPTVAMAPMPILMNV
ncbi:hypothetical protein JCM1841_002437 [Sporobolomyces salmonicolor]